MNNVNQKEQACKKNLQVESHTLLNLQDITEPGKVGKYRKQYHSIYYVFAQGQILLIPFPNIVIPTSILCSLYNYKWY